jgi:hypothetical protein
VAKNTDNTESTAALLPGGVTQDQINGWKAEHGDIYRISIPRDGEGEPYTCYLKKPDRKTIAVVSPLVNTNPVKGNEVLLQNCWLGGDRDIQTNDDLFLSAAAKLGELFNIKEAEIAKL